MGIPALVIIIILLQMTRSWILAWVYSTPVLSHFIKDVVMYFNHQFLFWAHTLGGIYYNSKCHFYASLVLAYSFIHMLTHCDGYLLKKQLFVGHTCPIAYVERVHTLDAYLKSHVHMLVSLLKAHMYSKKWEKNIKSMLFDGVYGLS